MLTTSSIVMSPRRRKLSILFRQALQASEPLRHSQPLNGANTTWPLLVYAYLNSTGQLPLGDWEQFKLNFIVSTIFITSNLIIAQEEKGDKMLYTIRQAADLLGISPNKLYDLIHAGRIKCIKLGSMKVSKTEIDRFIEQSQGKDLTDPKNPKELEL